MAAVDIRGCVITYDVIVPPGPGSSTPFVVPLVWGHGLTSSRADEDVLPLVDTAQLATERTVLRYDARGHGESGDLQHRSEGDWAELADDQVALIDHLGWDGVALGGASMGAATALHAALTLRERVRALVLVIPPTAWESRAAQVDLYEQMATAVETRGTDVLVEGLRATPPPDPFADDDDWTDRRMATLARADPKRLAAAFRGAGTADLPTPEAIRTIGVPTLVLAWTGDPGHPTATAHRLGDLLPHCDVVISSTRDEFDTWTTRTADFLGSL
jgi:pimeloyl-ACP methyl ester carboxylesterase